MSDAREIHTDREFYGFVMRLVERHAGSQRSLEDYLKALLALASREREQTAISLEQLAVWLDRAFVDESPPFDARWLDAHDRSADADASGHARWESCIQRQIVDLHEMRANGTLDNDMRSFGIDSPRGERWYNFTPLAFLECGVEGRYGDCDGDDPEVTIDPMGWDAFADFLEAGQWYE